MADSESAPALQIRRMDHPPHVTAVLPLQQSSAGGSGSFLVRADDERRYWCKCLENTQGSVKVPINEQIVGRLGKLLGAATCEVTLVKIPEDLAGWEFRPGAKLRAGYVHGSLAVDNIIEGRGIEHLADDDNHRRLTTLRALAEWCCGSDPQWLRATTEENRYYSHDHGHYFPSGPSWTIASLRAGASQGAGFPALSLDSKCAEELGAKLRALTIADIAQVLSALPAGWPVTDDELTEMAQYLDVRRGIAFAALAPKETSK